MEENKNKKFEELLDILIEMAGGEEIDDMDFDPYKPGRVTIKIKNGTED